MLRSRFIFRIISINCTNFLEKTLIFASYQHVWKWTYKAAEKEIQVSKQSYNSTSLICLGIIVAFISLKNSSCSVSLPLTTLLCTYKKDKLIYFLELFTLPERKDTSIGLGKVLGPNPERKTHLLGPLYCQTLPYSSHLAGGIRVQRSISWNGIRSGWVTPTESQARGVQDQTLQKDPGVPLSFTYSTDFTTIWVHVILCIHMSS